MMTRVNERRRLAAIIGVGVVLLCALIALASAAQAHRVFSNANGVGAYPDGVYPVTYQNVRWAFDSGFPSGGQRRAVIAGAAAWNNLGRRLQFLYDSRSLSTEREFDGSRVYCSNGRPPLERDGQPLSAVFSEALASNRREFVTLARAATCFRRGEMVGFRMAFNSDPSMWYYGSSASVPDNRFDMQSVAVHEFGHAGGFAPHYDGRGSLEGPEPCQRSNLNRETMCAVTYRGQARQRTLGRHDRHTFEGAYSR